MLAKYYSGDQIKDDEMGGACSTRGEKRNAYRILAQKLRERNNLEGLVVDVRIMLREVGWEGID